MIMRKYWPLLLILTLTSVAQNNYSLSGNRSAWEVEEVLEENRRRNEQINRYIEECNRETERRLDGLEDRLRAAIMASMPRSQQTGTPAQNNVTKIGGIQIISDPSPNAPRKPDYTRKREQEARLRQQQEYNARRARQKKAEIEAIRQRKAERARRLEEEEQRKRQEIYNRTYAAEYARGDQIARQLSAQAHWRTNEGADLLAMTHNSSNLMYADVEKNFDQPTSSAGIHSIKPIKRRRVAIEGLDPHAIPWATMSADARPYSEWSSMAPVLAFVDSVPPLKALPITIANPSQWDELADQLPAGVMSNLRTAIYHECNGRIPDIAYDSQDEQYHLYDQKSHKIITVSGDGTEVTVHSLKEKDPGLEGFWKDIRESTAFSASGSVAGYNGNVSIAPSDGHIEADVSHNGKTKIKYDSKYNNITASQEIFDTSRLGGDGGNKEKDAKSSFIKDLNGQLATKVKIYENSSEIKHKKIYLSSQPNLPSFGIEGNIGVGLEVKASASAKAGVKSGIGLSVNGDASIARGGFEVSVMSKPPIYGGMCFLTGGASAKLGYSYTLKRGKKSAKNASLDYKQEVGRNIGAWPISIVGVSGITCYSSEEIDKAFENKSKK